MFAQLKRHPFPVRALFEHSLVLTYALPPRTLSPHLPPGLALDEYNGSGLLAIALVQTRGLRPVGIPAALGQDFFLAGYRVFVKHRGADGRTRRGLKIIRSYADRRLMVWAGNLLTHYNPNMAALLDWPCPECKSGFLRFSANNTKFDFTLHKEAKEERAEATERVTPS